MGNEVGVDDDRYWGSGGGVIRVVFILVGMHLLVDRIDALRRLCRYVELELGI